VRLKSAFSNLALLGVMLTTASPARAGFLAECRYYLRGESVSFFAKKGDAKFKVNGQLVFSMESGAIQRASERNLGLWEKEYQGKRYFIKRVQNPKEIFNARTLSGLKRLDGSPLGPATDLVQADGNHYLVMQYRDGLTWNSLFSASSDVKGTHRQIEQMLGRRFEWTGDAIAYFRRYVLTHPDFIRQRDHLVRELSKEFSEVHDFQVIVEIDSEGSPHLSVIDSESYTPRVFTIRPSAKKVAQEVRTRLYLNEWDLRPDDDWVRSFDRRR
jgi:hypothetical protein